MANSTQHFTKVAEALKDLPVAPIADKVVQSVQDKNATVLTAQTGSGKTLLLSSALADASDHQVVVLVPRRLLAINAAETIAHLSGATLGHEVGFAIGEQSGDKSQFGPDTKLLFTTYGYALNAGLLSTAKTVVLDEVHEAGIDTSLARAILHKRLEHDKNLQLLEMSATVDAGKQAEYWKDVRGDKTAIFHAEGKSYPCEFIPEGDTSRSFDATLLGLIEKGAKGVIIFKPGVKEVEDTAVALKKFLDTKKTELENKGITGFDISTVYGDMDMEERKRATQPAASGRIKILVGTNVVESGVNIPWLDAGISDGKCKVPYTRHNGAEALVSEDLPQWRIIQQMGRVNRMGPGMFVLHSKTGMQQRALKATPEISRISLNDLALKAASYGLDPTILKYDAPIDAEKWQKAKKDLERLGLINQDWKLTEKGQFVCKLPLGAEAGTMLWAATHEAPKEIIHDAIELAAMVEVKGLRLDYKKPFGRDDTSDIFDALSVFKELGHDATKEQCVELNVNWKRYQELRALIENLTLRSEISGAVSGIENRPATPKELKQIMLEGSINHLFEVNGHFKDLVRNEGGYEHDDTSAVPMPQSNGPRFAIAMLREIPSKHHDKEKVVAERVTSISSDDLCAFAARHNGVLSNIRFDSKNNGSKKYRFTADYCGITPVTIGVPHEKSAEMQALIEPAFSEWMAAKPQGINNTSAYDVSLSPPKAMMGVGM